MLTDEQLAEIEGRLNAATPGPWRENDRYPHKEGLLMTQGGERIICVFCDIDECDDQDILDSRFIAHAPADIGALLAEVCQLKAENSSLRADRSAHEAGDDMLMELMGFDDES